MCGYVSYKFLQGFDFAPDFFKLIDIGVNACLLWKVYELNGNVMEGLSYSKKFNDILYFLHTLYFLGITQSPPSCTDQDVFGMHEDYNYFGFRY